MQTRRFRFVSMVALSLLFGSVWTPQLSAQDATPDSESQRPAEAETATLGTAVTYIDAEGIEHGEVAVTEVIDPFTDFDEGYEPAEGTRYVVLYVSFEATGEKPFEADPYDILVRDADGFLWSLASVNRGSEPAMPDAQSQSMAPGNRISGAVGYIVPEATPLAQVYYQPVSGQLILLADLQDDDVQSPTVGDEVTYSDIEGVEHGVVSVTEVIDPFTDYPEGYEPAEETRYVVIYVSFEATGDSSFDANPGHLLVRDADGYLWAWATVNRGSEPEMPDAQSQTLAPGNKISGAVGFVVPADTALAQIYYQPVSGHLILLANVE